VTLGIRETTVELSAI